jgi:hypothetical protein
MGKKMIYSKFIETNFIYLGISGRCTPGLCQNGGICEERLSGVITYAYCRCPAGVTGQCCQTRK